MSQKTKNIFKIFQDVSYYLFLIVYFFYLFPYIAFGFIIYFIARILEHKVNFIDLFIVFIEFVLYFISLLKDKGLINIRELLKSMLSVEGFIRLGSALGFIICLGLILGSMFPNFLDYLSKNSYFFYLSIMSIKESYPNFLFCLL
jgi:hypothetical protein